MTDLYFQEQGSIWLVPPATPKAEAWMTDYPSVRIRWFGATENRSLLCTGSARG